MRIFLLVLGTFIAVMAIGVFKFFRRIYKAIKLTYLEAFYVFANFSEQVDIFEQYMKYYISQLK